MAGSRAAREAGFPSGSASSLRCGGSRRFSTPPATPVAGSRAAREAGFTLVEMLVASAIFIIGFVGVFALFLSGIRFRKLSEDITRTALASSSLVSEIRIDAGREGAAKPPQDYVGDGFASDASDAALSDDLYAYPQQPGIWYRVMACTDLSGDPTNVAATALRLRLVTVSFATSDTALTFTDVKNRLRLKKADGSDPIGPDEIATELTRRGVAMTTNTVIVRRPAWMP
jgi:prepilin-type N-terminal cleavage/methylation domain-containing protein